VLKITADEFHGVERHRAKTGTSLFFVTECNLALVDADNPTVRNGDLEDIRGQILQASLAAADGLGIDIPGNLPDVRLDLVKKPVLFHLVPEFGAKYPGKRPDRQEEIDPRRMPEAGFPLQRTAGDNVMNVRVIFQLSAPGVQNPEKAGAIAAHQFVIGDKLFQCS